MSTARHRSDRGQATVELALVLPAVVLLLAVVVQVGVLARDRVALVHDARVAARAVVVDPSTAAARAALRSAGAGETGVAVAGSTAAGQMATVTVTRAPTRLPLIGSLLASAEMSEELTVMVEGSG